MSTQTRGPPSESHPPTAHGTPAESRVCRLRNSESALRIPPPIGGQMPPRQPCHPDRRALSSFADKPAVLSDVSACRRFPDQESPPAALLLPGLSAPKRKARSQSRLRPRKLRVIRLSLRSSRLAAACRLRQTCRRDRGPVSLPRSGCPVRRSQHPAAIAQSLLPPLPAAFCGRIPRLARVVAPAKEGWGCTPYPAFARFSRPVARRTRRQFAASPALARPRSC